MHMGWSKSDQSCWVSIVPVLLKFYFNINAAYDFQIDLRDFGAVFGGREVEIKSILLAH